MVKRKITPITQTQIYRLFFLEKTVPILLNCSDLTYSTRIAKEVDVTYSHCNKMIKLFKSLGLINLTKKGRQVLITLTEDGKEIKKLFEKTLRKMKKINEKQ